MVLLDIKNDRLQGLFESKCIGVSGWGVCGQLLFRPKLYTLNILSEPNGRNAMTAATQEAAI